MVFYNFLASSFLESSSSLQKEGTRSHSFLIYTEKKPHGIGSLNLFLKRPSVCSAAIVTSASRAACFFSHASDENGHYTPEALHLPSQSCRRTCNSDCQLEGWILKNVHGRSIVSERINEELRKDTRVEVSSILILLLAHLLLRIQCKLWTEKN